jgi:hypothetical protein
MKIARIAPWVAVALVLPVDGDGAGPTRSAHARDRLFVMLSPNIPPEAPHVFSRYLEDGDYARVETLPDDVRVERRFRYALPTTLRRRWAGEPGLRHWTARGCGRGTPGTLVYDIEHWNLTPVAEQRSFAASIREGARLAVATGCHAYGVAPDASYLFGKAGGECDYDIGSARYRDIPWDRIDLIDLQVQDLVSDECFDDYGIHDYVAVASTVATHARARNPRVLVVAQVSFRLTPPARMSRAVAAVADVVDGVYLAYPTLTHPDACRYCTPGRVRAFLSELGRGPVLTPD